MKRATALPELLAPAGDMSCLHAAVAAGADAVYLGGIRFGARAYAKNFGEEELREAIVYAHSFGVRVYVTLNTLIYDKEIEEAVSYAETLHGMGVDALIVADVGICAQIRKRIPSLSLHASTQMGVHNTKGVDFAAALGCERVVLARECSLENIRAITERSSAEIEVFLHGALCVCHSGQCLFSSLVGGRSGNRGECAQPCRLPYGKGYPLSLKDLSLANHVRELVESGVASLKIEGRMKSPDYVYQVTSIYRRLLDESRNANESENRRLADVFSRGGFTDGYFVGKLGTGMTGIRSQADKDSSRTVSVDSIPSLTLPVSATASFKRAEPSRLTLKAKVKVRCTGEEILLEASSESLPPEEAKTYPLTEASLLDRLSKLGGTGFELQRGTSEITLDEGINLAPSAINALRRDAADKLKRKLMLSLNSLGSEVERRVDEKLPSFRVAEYHAPVKTSLLALNPSVIREITAEISRLKPNVVFVPLFSHGEIKAENWVTGVYIPPVIMENEWEKVSAELDRARARGYTYALLGNVSHLALAYEKGMIPVLDFRMNVASSLTADLYRSLGITDMILSPELTLPMARDVGGGIIALGRIPLMLTERCFIKENFGCEKCGKSALTDRTGAAFPMMREWEHRNLILNSHYTYMGDRADELRKYRIEHLHIILSTESVGEVKALLRAFSDGARLNSAHRRIGSHGAATPPSAKVKKPEGSTKKR